MPTYLPDDAARALDERLSVIRRHRRRNTQRTAYAEGEQRLAQISPTIPPPMRDLAIVVGWPKKVLGVIGDRIHPEGFRVPADGDETLLRELEEIMEEAGFPEKDAMARHTALLYGCAFIFTSINDDGTPVYVVRSPLEATVGWDNRAGLPFSGIEVIAPGHVMLFTAEWTLELKRDGGRWTILDENEASGRLTCTVYRWDPSLHRPLGNSAITRPVMGLTDIAVRTILRQEVSAEFYSSPQRYMLGADPSMFEDENGEIMPAWQTLLGGLLVAPTHVDDESLEMVTPSVGQFPQMSMQPHSDQLRSIAMMFAGESSIPPSRLGVIHDNPASAAAMLADEADLITTAERGQPDFARSRKSVLLDTAHLITGGSTTALAGLKRATTRYRAAGTPNTQAQAQSVTMLVSNGILPPTGRVTWEMMGFDDATIQRLEQQQRGAGATTMMESLRAAAAAARQDPVVAAAADRRLTTETEPEEAPRGITG